MIYYIKNDKDEFVETNTDAMFNHRHDRWVATESDKIRSDVEKSVREELTTSIEADVVARVTGEFQPKLDEATRTADDLRVQVRQKTIAAEYGFKAETEKYLGNGDEAAMRKEADILKSNFTGAAGASAPTKNTPGDTNTGFIKLETQ